MRLQKQMPPARGAFTETSYLDDFAAKCNEFKRELQVIALAFVLSGEALLLAFVMLLAIGGAS